MHSNQVQNLYECLTKAHDAMLKLGPLQYTSPNSDFTLIFTTVRFLLYLAFVNEGTVYPVFNPVRSMPKKKLKQSGKIFGAMGKKL